MNFKHYFMGRGNQVGLNNKLKKIGTFKAQSKITGSYLEKL